MKILLCIAGLGPGGGERQFIRLINQLAQAGHEVRVHVFGSRAMAHYDAAGSLGPRIHFTGVTSGRRLSAVWPILRDLRRLSREFEPDIIYATLFKASAAVRLARLLGLVRGKIVTTLRIDYQKAFSWREKWTERALCGYSDAIITNHLPTCEYFAKIIGQRSQYIPNGIDDADLNLCGTPERTGDHSILRILCIGRLRIGYKNQEELVKALALVRGQLSREPRLTIVGQGRDRQRLGAAAEDLGLAEIVEIIPPVRDPTHLYLEASAVAHVAVLEGTPNVLLEAMLTATPLIVSAYVGGLGIVEDGRTAIVARGNDAAALAEAILRFDSLDPSACREMGLRARTRVLKEFSTQAMVHAHLQLFTRLLAQR